MSRPRKEISAEQFEKLCGLQCTLSEIAGFFDCSEDTIERWCRREYEISFADAFKKYSASGKMSLRRYQFDLAKKNATMAIFLGKQYLGQRDTPSDGEMSEPLKKALEIIGGIPSAINSETDGIPPEL